MAGSNCSYNYVYLCIQCSLSLHSNTAIGEVYWIQRHVKMFISYIHIKLIYQWTKCCTIIINTLNLKTYIFCDILIFYGFMVLACANFVALNIEKRLMSFYLTQSLPENGINIKRII